MTMTDQVSAFATRVAEELNTKASLNLVTRTLSHSNGGLGTYATTYTTTSSSFRIVVKLPVTTTKWRLRLRNYDTYNRVNKTALTIKKVIHGDHLISTTGTGGETGNFVGNTATTILATDLAIPGTSTPVYTDWVTDSGDQFEAGKQHLIGIAWSAASSFAMQQGMGKCWRWSDATSGVNPATASSGGTVAFIPLDWVIEYETTSDADAFLFVGDSITEGTSGPQGVLNTAPTPTSLYRSYPHQWSARTGALVQSHALYALLATDITSPAHDIYTRQDTSLGAFTGAVVALGSNDIGNLRTLAQVQADVLTVINNVRGIIGADKPIYYVNVSPRSFAGATASAEPIRVSFNNWLAELPGGLTGVANVDQVVRGTTASAMITDLTSDTVHPSWRGQGIWARELTSTVIV